MSRGRSRQDSFNPLTHVGFAEPPSRTPSSSTNNKTNRAHKLAVENIPAPLVGRAASQPSINTIVSAHITGHEYSVTSPPSQIGHSYDTWVANDVQPALHQNQLQSSVFSGIPQSTPPYQDEERDPIYELLLAEHNNPTLPQATQPRISTPIDFPHPQAYPTSSINQHYLVNRQHDVPYIGHHPTIQHPRVETVSRPGALSERQYLMDQSPHQISNQTRSRLQHMSDPGLFNQAHDFTIKDSVFVDNGSNNFMTSFLKETIIGAEFDSSDHNMPLRCHPGTRLGIIKRCQNFILSRDGRPKLRWVVGAAGVGKSAIMQSVAHDESGVLSSIIVGATIFFSINGRQDGMKAITTIAYQIAVKLNSYRLFVQREVTHDPSLLRKSLPTQFNKFIVEPFIHQSILGCSSRLLIIIDGLDECADTSVQKELLGLISDSCIAHPTSPIVWMIASRPEPQITSFFSRQSVAFSYEKEEILVDSDEACEDVKRYLHDKFREVQMTSITLQELPQWSSEDNLLKVAHASGGLFAYASTVVRYISDPDYGDPASLLDDVLEIIETGTKENIWGRNHPMAQLDALYSHIMSKIPAKVVVNTRKLLLLCLDEKLALLPFRLQSNMLGMTRNSAYGATHHIRSIAKVPGPTKTLDDHLRFFHKSFPDYLRDYERSGFSSNIRSEVEQLMCHSALRVIREAPEGAYMDGASAGSSFMPGGVLKARPGAANNISITWPTAGDQGACIMRLVMYDKAVEVALEGFKRGAETFRSLLCIRVLTTCFSRLPEHFPLDAMLDFTFDKCRRGELLERGILKQIPLGKLDYDSIATRHCIRLCFRGPMVKHSNPWNMLCEHKREGSWQGQSQDWSTKFTRPEKWFFTIGCNYCSERFSYHFKMRSLAHVVTVLDLTPTFRQVELQFVDPGDGVSDWIYCFYIGKDG